MSRDGRVALLLGALATAAHTAGAWIPSFWYDETASLQLARLPWDEFWAFVAHRDAVHGLYALFLDLWMRIFGESELAVRAPSILAIGCATAGVQLLARRLGADERGGVLGAAVFALLPRIAIQAVEARSLAIATALLVAAALLLLRAIRRRSPASWAAYVVVAALAGWCFVYAALVLPAFAVLAAGSRGARRARMARVAAVLLPAVSLVPLLVTMSSQTDQVAWLAGETVTPYTVLIEPLFGWAVWSAALVAALIAAAVWRRVLVYDERLWMIVTWLVVPVVALVAGSVLVLPMFAPRYLTICAPALAVLCALSARALPPRWATSFVLVWALSAVPFVVSTRLPASKPGGIDLRAIAGAVAQGAAPGDGILLGTDGVRALQPRVVLAAYPATFAGLDDLALARPFTATGTYSDELVPPEDLDLARAQTVWVIDRDPSTYDAALRAAGMRPVEQTRITGIDVTRWRR